jgi:hypothetical protein
MFIATNHPSNTLRSVRSEISFPPDGAPSMVVALLRSASLITTRRAINISPRWGEIRQHHLLHFKLEFANDKMLSAFLLPAPAYYLPVINDVFQ